MPTYNISPSNMSPLVVKPKEARRMLSCGHTRLYELLAACELESFKDGRSRKILVSSIEDYIARRLAQVASPKQLLGVDTATPAAGAPDEQ